MKKIAILGSTGSIGTQSLDVIRRFPDKFKVVSMTCGKNKELFRKQLKEFRPLVAVTADRDDAEALERELSPELADTRFAWGEEGLIAAATLAEADIVLNSLMGMRGLVPTYHAIESGKDIALANKETLVAGGELVMNLAGEKGVSLLYEASCGGTIPIIEEILRIGKLDAIDKVYGILNGTCNYILWQMDKNSMDYGEALSLAQKAGYAEADPRADVSGFDVRNKIIILSSLAFDSFLEQDIPTVGIERIDKDLLCRFRSEGKVIKLLGMAVCSGSSYALAVAPAAIPETALEAGVPENFNMISFNGEYSGEIKLYGQGAGGDPTADAVVRDVEKILYKDPAEYGRTFEKKPGYDPALLRGTCHVGDQIYPDSVLSDMALKAEKEGKSFVFEFNA